MNGNSTELLKIRSLSNDNGNVYENVTYKVNSRCLKLYCNYSISFNSSNVVKFFFSWILNHRIKVQEKKKKAGVVCSHPQQKVKLGTSVIVVLPI